MSIMRQFIFSLWKKDLGEAETKRFRPIQQEINEGMEKVVTKKDYGDAVRSVLVAPELVPKDYVHPKGYRVRKFDKLAKAAMYRFPIDRDSFLSADDRTKIKFIADNIVASIKDLRERITGDFAADALVRDVQEVLTRIANET